MVLEMSDRPGEKRPLPVFNSRRAMTPDEMDEEIRSHIEQRVQSNRVVSERISRSS